MEQPLKKLTLIYNKQWVEPLIVALLILAFITLSIYSSSHENAVNDETVHIPAGISYVKTHDMRMNAEHPPLVKYLSGLSVEKFTDSEINSSSFTWRFSEQWKFGRDTLFKDNNHESITFWARIPIVLLSTGLALAIFFFSRMMFGKAVALSALSFFCLDPTMIAYSHLVTFDLPAATFIAFCSMFLYMGFNKQNYWLFLLSGIALGLALSSKASALAFLPVIFVLLVACGYKKKSNIAKLIKNLCTQIALISLGSIATLWAVYFMVEGSFPDGEGLLPKSFLDTMQSGLDRYGVDKSTYIAGTHYDTGQRWFLPFSFLMKSPIPLLLIIGVGLVFLFIKSHRSKDLNVHVVFPIVFLGSIASISTLNWGIRYLFLIYPFVFIFAGYASVKMIRTFTISQVLIPIFTIYYAFTLIYFFPSYIPYINELGGSKNTGYQTFAGSNVDWGQGQKLLKAYLQENDLPTPTIAYWVEGGTMYYPQVYGFKSIGIFTRGRGSINKLSKTEGLLAVSTYLANNIGLNKVNYEINGQKPFAVISGSWLLYKF